MTNGMVAVKLTWDDNSTGSLDETGQEIEIWTDSPSFVPNISINYMEARHPWMRLPPIASGVEEMTLSLQAPITFLKFRVRQYNAKGQGAWATPVSLPIAVPVGAGVPPAPTGLGGAVVGAVDPPPPPPVTPPPPPPPTGGGGASSNYSFLSQFSGVQGGNQWSYRDGNGNNLVYSAADQKWSGTDLYLAIWNGGFHHGWSIGVPVVLRFTVPVTGQANITGSHKLYQGFGGATFDIEHNGVSIYSQAMNSVAEYFYDEDIAVTAGDTIDFILTRDTASVNNNTQLNPVIQLTTDGTTPQNPSLSSLTPSALALSIGGAGTLVAELVSPAITAATVSLTNSDAGKVSAPASVSIPLGQTRANIPVSGLASGSSTITATYSGVSKQSIVSVQAPVSATWKNAPAGGVLLKDWNFSALSGNGFGGGFGNGRLDSDPLEPASPPTVVVSRLELNTHSGGGQLAFYAAPGVKFRELYAGMMLRQNAQWTGRPVASDKMFFLRGPDSNGLLVLGGGLGKPQEGVTPYVVFTHNAGNVDNSHIMSLDKGLRGEPNINPSAARVTPGSWYKLEFWIRCSTTLTSRDGAVKWWVNDVLAGYYEQLNYGTAAIGLTNWVWTETWDGSGIPAHTAPLEHWLGHLYLMGKN